MLDIKRIREEPDAVRAGLATKGVDTSAVDSILERDAQRRHTLTDVETLKSRRNSVSKEIGMRKKKGEDTSDEQAAMREWASRLQHWTSAHEPLMNP